MSKKLKRLIPYEQPIIESAPKYNKLKPLTKNQYIFIKAIQNNRIVMCDAKTGVGKTYCAAGVSIGDLLEGRISKIIVMRPYVSNELYGFLPGTIEQKFQPFLQPFYDAALDFISHRELQNLIKDRTIELCPFGFLKGRTFKDCYVIADECQDCSYDQIKMLLYRMGKNSKLILIGSNHQSDLNSNQQGGFEEIIRRLDGMEGVSIPIFSEQDIIRDPLTSLLYERLEN